jgi:hypothetical protein
MDEYRECSTDDQARESETCAPDLGGSTYPAKCRGRIGTQVPYHVESPREHTIPLLRYFQDNFRQNLVLDE